MTCSNDIRQKTKKFLMDLISIPSTRGNEGPASRYAASQIQPYVDRCELVSIDDSIMQDKDYAFPLPGFTYKDTPNVECIIEGYDDVLRLCSCTLDVVLHRRSGRSFKS
jgi:hypothetical protein